MCNSVATKRTAADIAEQAARDAAYSRQTALQLAHDPKLPTEEVIARAQAYIAFIES